MFGRSNISGLSLPLRSILTSVMTLSTPRPLLTLFTNARPPEPHPSTQALGLP